MSGNEHVAEPFRSILESVAPKAGGGAGGPSRSLPPHESARTVEARNRIADRMIADAMAQPEPEPVTESGLKLWRFADILTDKSWGDESTLQMIADAMVGLGWRIHAARVRLADKHTNLADVIARIEAEAKRLDRIWMAKATATMHEYAAKVVQHG